MADILVDIGNGLKKRFKDMGDGTVAEVFSVSGSGGGAGTTRNLTNKGCVAWMGRRGKYDLTAAGTFQASIAMPGEFDSVQLIFTNTNSDVSFQVNSASVSMATTVSDLNNSSGTWVQVTKKQSTIFHLECPQGNGSGSLEALTLTDQTPIRGKKPVDGNFPILIMRATFAAAAVATNGGLPVGGDASVGATGDVYTNWATRTDGQIRAWRFQAGSLAGAGTQSGFTSTTNINQCPIVGAVLRFKGKVVQYVSFGDSNRMAAAATYREENAAFICATDCNALNNGLVHCHASFAWSGAAANGYNGSQRRARNYLKRNELPCDFLFLEAVSPNDYVATITQATLETSARELDDTIALAQSRGIDVILDDWCPVGYVTRAWDATDPLRVAENARIYERNGGGIKVLQIANLIPLVANVSPSGLQQEPLANTNDQTSFGYPFDRIHWSDALHKAEAAMMKTYVLPRVGVN